MNNRYTYFFAKLPIALSMLGHGLVRLPKLGVFSDWMVGFMKNSYLPHSLITGFSYIVPFAETIIGLLLLLGLYTRQTLFVATILLSLFIFGNTTIENWEAITSELVHAAYFIALLFLINYDQFSIDHKRTKH